MNQFDLAHLFDRFDDALRRGRELNDPSRLKADAFMLLRIDEQICTFRHLVTGVTVRFDARLRRIVA